MELEVISRHDLACETFLAVDRSRHQILDHDWPWLSWARQFAPDSRLVVYRHLHTGSFVLGAWVYDPTETEQPVLMEMESFTGSPTALYPKDLLHPQLLTFRLAPADQHREKWSRMAKDGYARKKKDREERIEFRQSRARYLKRRGMDRAAYEMEIGATPVADPTSESREMWTSMLKSARKVS